MCPDAVLGASDLLLKWVTLRFFDTNPSVLLKCLDFVQALLLLFSESNEQLSDNEVNSFVPYLLMKVRFFPKLTYYFGNAGVQLGVPRKPSSNFC